MRTDRRVCAVVAAVGVSALALGACGTGSGANSGMPVPQRTSSAPVTAAARATTSATTTSSPTHSVVTRTVSEIVAIPFEKRTVEDAALAVGTRTVRTAGVEGAKTVFYTVTMTDGVETGRSVEREEVIRQPVTEVTAVGTKAPPTAKSSPTSSAAPKALSSGCDPNYSGACVPIASDVDCSSGKGNGPAYVQGPVRVVGEDIYGLDSDGDGIGCEKG
jgi:resuscitation-promoting factor RpfB